MKTGTVLEVAQAPVVSRGTSYGHWLCLWIAASPFGDKKQQKDARFFKKKEAEEFLAMLRGVASRGEVYPPLTGEEKRNHCWEAVK